MSRDDAEVIVESGEGAGSVTTRLDDATPIWTGISASVVTLNPPGRVKVCISILSQTGMENRFFVAPLLRMDIDVV